MCQIKNNIIGVVAVAIFAFGLIGSGASSPPRPPPVYENGVFQLKQKPDDIFTKPSLSTILKSSGTLAIVLRVPNSGKDVTEQQRQVNDSLYNTIEKELAKAGYIVRDRALFAKVLDQESLDYSKIGQLTKTDLILELVSYSTKEKYFTKEYKDEAGNNKIADRNFSLRGATIEFKLTSVKENDLVGSYIFYHTPCTEPCRHRFSFSRSSTLSIPSPISQENLFKSWVLRLINELEIKRG